MKLCEIYDEGCSSLSFDYTCKIRDGTELEMETQSDTRLWRGGRGSAKSAAGERLRRQR